MKEKMEGLVTAVYRERYVVRLKSETSPLDGEEIFARLKAGIYYTSKYNEKFPTVGDIIELEYNPIGDSLIVKTISRKSKFSRSDSWAIEGEQVVAANFDYVFIMMSLNFDFNLKRLERYITSSWQSGAKPVVVLTKADIANDIEEKIKKVKKIAMNVDIYAVSCVTGEGMDNLKKYLQPDKTIVFLGSSGVGKSTFTNYLLGKEVMKTMEIREDDSKGHHTTTHRQLFVLENGAKIIDTPGMRELGMMNVDDGIEHSFYDVQSLIMQCKFSKCTHTIEPDCVIKESLENGTLSEARWKNYLKIQRESAAHRVKKKKVKELKTVNRKMMKTYPSKIGSREEEW